MKKVYFIIGLLASSLAGLAQVPNAGMENWRTDTVGGSTGILGHTIVPLQEPMTWFGSDSLVIALGQSFGPAAFGTVDTDWHRQIFRESVKKHSGYYSAKIMTARQDTFVIPGVISNAVPSVSFTILPSPSITGITLNGGTATTVKPVSVSAWVQYIAGKNASGYTGIDSGELRVQALSFIDGQDSIIGTGTVTIGPDTSWELVTARLVYIDSIHPVDTFRIAFASSNNTFGLDSSTLYVDDITMITEPNPANYAAVPFVTSGANSVKVYPNPSAGCLYMDNEQNGELSYSFYSVSGALVASGKLEQGPNAIDISSLPDGLYFYDVHSSNGIVQRGKIALSR